MNMLKTLFYTFFPTDEQWANMDSSDKAARGLIVIYGTAAIIGVLVFIGYVLYRLFT